MGKLDVSHMKYLSRAHFRVLTSIEMGMKNHEHVPELLVCTISGINKRLCVETLKDLVKMKLAKYTRNSNHDGFSLTYYGYDTLSLRALVLQNAVVEVGSKVGVGKESDIYVGRNESGERIILKFHRLGRNSFKKVIDKRDYLDNRQYASWLYLSRLSAIREFRNMSTLVELGFPVPNALAQNRHCVVMSLVDGFPLSQINKLDNPMVQYKECCDILTKLAEHGLIHCDFNEFNLIVNENGSIIMIDFPQMISVDHPNADFYFKRDFLCTKSFFEKRFDLDIEEDLELTNVDLLSTTHSDPLLQTLNDQDLFEKNISNDDFKDIADSIDELEIDKTDSQILPNNQEIFSHDYITNKVHQNLSKKDLKLQCFNAVRNSKKTHNNRKSRQFNRNINVKNI